MFPILIVLAVLLLLGLIACLLVVGVALLLGVRPSRLLRRLADALERLEERVTRSEG